MPLTLTENQTTLEAAQAALRKLAGTTLQIGIPPEKDVHAGPFSASGLLALHEAGSPINRMPPRPVLGPALASPETREALTAALMRALEAAHAGNTAAMESFLEQAGQAGADALRSYVESGGHLAPPVPYTGWIRNRVSGKPVFISEGSGTPLIRTGELINAFGYKIKE